MRQPTSAPFELRRRLLCHLSLLAACVAVPARAQEEGAHDGSLDVTRRASAPSRPTPYGWVGLGAGLVAIDIHRTAIAEESSVRFLEGDATGLWTASLEYQLPAFIVTGRVFVRHTAWKTEFSDWGNYGTRRIYDFGGAPALAHTFDSGRQSVAIYGYVPLSLSVSHMPPAPRQAVRESADTGLGYRVGVGMGGLVAVSRHLGFFANAEWATQALNHTLSYHAVDGRSPDVSLDVRHTVTWFGLWLGVALLP